MLIHKGFRCTTTRTGPRPAYSVFLFSPAFPRDNVAKVSAWTAPAAVKGDRERLAGTSSSTSSQTGREYA